ncbi:hypothetical protein HK098_005633 [Nowakowskiella sp. JEL0407]|nr:hypothetical protein HK098_005633 [Nowakowskiella sp. JEL0407]
MSDFFKSPTLTNSLIPILTSLFIASWTYNYFTTPQSTRKLESDREKRKVSKFEDIPGPVALPMFGNALGVIPHALVNRIDNFFNDINKTYGSVARVNMAGRKFVVLSDSLAIKEMFTNMEQVDRDASLIRAFEGILDYFLATMPHDDVWKRHRKGLQPAFGPSHIKDAFKIAMETVDELADIWERKFKSGETTRNISHESVLVTSDVIGKFSLGIDLEAVKNAETKKRPELIELMEPIVTIFIRRYYIVDYKFLWPLLGVSVSDVEPKISRIREILEKPINAKREKLSKLPKDSGKDHVEYWKKDVLERLFSPALKIAHEEEVVFSEDEIRDEVFSLYLSGFESTSLTISAIVYELCRNSEMQERLRDEIDRVYDAETFQLDTLNNFVYLDAFFKEVLRLYVVAPQIPRLITSPLELETDEGFSIHLPAGTEVLSNVNMLHKNKNLWGDDAEEFKPDRWLSGSRVIRNGIYYPFGGGHFVCLGQKLATVEVKMFIIRMLQRFEFKLADGKEPVFEYAGSFGLRRFSAEVSLRK